MVQGRPVGEERRKGDIGDIRAHISEHFEGALVVSKDAVPFDL